MDVTETDQYTGDLSPVKWRRTAGSNRIGGEAASRGTRAWESALILMLKNLDDLARRDRIHFKAPHFESLRDGQVTR
jgi:hypothetical protein